MGIVDDRDLANAANGMTAEASAATGLLVCVHLIGTPETGLFSPIISGCNLPPCNA